MGERKRGKSKKKKFLKKKRKNGENQKKWFEKSIKKR